MSARSDRPLALTLGEPAGVGPDLTLAIWRRRVELDLPPFYLIGEPDFLMRRAQLFGLDVPVMIVTPQDAGAAFDRALPVVPLDLAISAAPGKPDASSAPAAIAAIRRAVADVLAGHAAAIVTNPVAKNVLYRSGFAEPGHTEFLARLAAEATGKPLHPVMMLWSPELAVVPVTIHLPLREVPGRITADLVEATGRIVARDLAARFGIARPRLAIAGLNPHAGKTARWAARTLQSLRPRSSDCRPKASMRAVRCRPIRCSTSGRGQPMTRRCACITTKR